MHIAPLLLPPLLLRLAGAISHQTNLLSLSGSLGSASAESAASDRFWQGLDLRSEDDRHGLRKLRLQPVKAKAAGKALGHVARPSGRKMVLLGPFDTGTHLLLQTLMANYKGELHRACGWDSIVIDGDRTSHCRVWKHGANISDSRSNQGGLPLYQVLERQGLHLGEVVVVMLVRSPLSSLVSWKHNPYDLGPCVGRAMAKYGEPCRAKGMMWKGRGQRAPSSTSEFLSTMDAYNHYMRMYQAIKSEKRVTARMVTYEDLVISPGDVVSDVARAMGWPHRGSVNIFAQPAKSEGNAVGRALAISKLRSRDWLESIPSEEARRAMCRDLDRSAVRGIVDNSYNSSEASRPYDFDCEGYA